MIDYNNNENNNRKSENGCEFFTSLSGHQSSGTDIVYAYVYATLLLCMQNSLQKGHRERKKHANKIRANYRNYVKRVGIFDASISE